MSVWYEPRVLIKIWFLEEAWQLENIIWETKVDIRVPYPGLTPRNLAEKWRKEICLPTLPLSSRISPEKITNQGQ